MGSRIKENPQKIFDLFFEAARQTLADDDPQVLRQFPVELDDQELIQMLPKFCFPFDVERVKGNPTVQHFTVALTDMEGKQHFGFCRMAMGFHTCLCILSYLPWFEVFYKILNMIAEHLAKEQFTELDEFLSTLYFHPVPNLSCSISLEFALYFIAPDHGKLPTIPENRNLTEFVVALDVNNMLLLYASLLHERRILLTTSKLSTLTACVQASSSMLYPMHWQHIYIPVLPPHLLDYCCAPMPYLIGVHTSLMEKVQSRALEDVVILNIDSNTLESPFQDLENLPSDVVSLLKYQLKKQSATAGDGVAQAFLRAQALLFGSYREALVCHPGEPISFCQDTFLQQRSGAMQVFLQQAVDLQLFKQFIDNRLEKLNAGEDFSDPFEQEINRSLSPGSMHSYQLWVENLKKGGGALLSTMKNKTNPAVRNAYKYAKVHAKIGLKNMKSHLKEKDASTGQNQLHRHSLNSDHISGPILPTRSKQSENLQSRLPITQHFGKSRPKRPQKQSSQSEPQTRSTASLEFPPDAVSEGDENLHPDFLESGGLDLLGEIFETLNLLEPRQGGRPLCGTRSLDFCNFEDRSSYTKLQPSRETLHESIFEGQDGDSLSEEPTFLPSLEQEDTLVSSTESADESSERQDQALSETQVIPGPEKATVPEEEMLASDSYELSQVPWTQNSNNENSPSSDNVTERCPAMESEEAKVDQTLNPPAAISTPKAELPASTCSSSQSSVASLQTKISAKIDCIAKESSHTPGRITSPHQPLVSRSLTQTRVSELKKRFEA